MFVNCQPRNAFLEFVKQLGLGFQNSAIGFHVEINDLITQHTAGNPVSLAAVLVLRLHRVGQLNQIAGCIVNRVVILPRR